MASLAAVGAVVVALLLDPDVVTRRFSEDGVLKPYTRQWLGTYRNVAWIAGGCLGLVAVWISTCRSAADRWIARCWLAMLRFGLALAFLIVASIAVEMVMRVIEAHGPPSRLGVDFDALARGFMGSVHAQLNADGMRDDSFDRPRTAGQRRVLVIGDSFAFGFGIAEREQTFAAALERDLAAHGSFDVFNAGVPGADTKRELETMRAVRARVDPDVVLVAWYVNDAESEADKRAYVRQNRLVPLVSDTLLRRSAAWRRIEPAVVGALVRCGLEQNYVDHLRQLYGLGEGGEWSQRNEFASLLKEAQAAGCRAAVVLFPLIEDLVHYPMEDVNAVVASACKEQGIPYIDLLETFRGESAAALQASAVDHHLNAIAAERAARVVADFLAREGLLESARSR